MVCTHQEYSEYFLTNPSSKCKIYFDMSQQKRKSFNDVARIAKPSDFEWLVDNIETMSLSEASYLNFSKVSSYPEDLKAYKNVRLSIRDRIEASDFTLEDDVGYVSEQKTGKRLI